ncbi:MAG: hypothetical protein E7673_00570 [Ruminococcaceae bacterium]|nr:hypothetical protein [Oscillospiraceae bacterium]
MSSKFLDFLFGYEHSEENFKNSRIAKAEKRFSDKVLVGIGYAYSKRILSSKAVKFFEKIKIALSEASIKCYGIFMLAFGLATLFLHFAEYYFLDFMNTPTAALIVGSSFTLVGFVLMFFDVPLVDSLQKWKLTNTILFDTLCLKRTRSAPKTNYTERAIIPVTIGIFFAAIGFIISIPATAIGALALVFITLSLASPEFALMTTLFALPFIPALPHSTLILSSMVVIAVVSFISKVLLGKRFFHFEQYDAVLLIFMLFVLISGIFNKGIVSFEKSLALVILASVYFLVSNVIVNRRLAENAVKIIVFSSVPTAIIGLILYFLTPTKAEWIDPLFTTEISSRAYSTFGNPNVYAVFLIVATVFSVALTIDKAENNSFFFYACASVLNAVSLALTWSRGAWVAALLAALAFIIIRSKRAPKLLLIPAMCIPVALLFIPESFANRLLSLFNLGDSSVASRLSIWRSSLRMFFDNIFIGIGVGEEAFAEEFLEYAEDSVTAPHSHNLFLEIGCEVGIFALLFFAFILLIRVRHRATYAKYVRNSSVDNISTLSGTALFALLVFGMTDYIWYSSSTYYLFWVVFGIGSATLRISKKEYDDAHSARYDERIENFASVNIPIE